MNQKPISVSRLLENLDPALMIARREAQKLPPDVFASAFLSAMEQDGPFPELEVRDLRQDEEGETVAHIHRRSPTLAHAFALADWPAFGAAVQQFVSGLERDHRKALQKSGKLPTGPTVEHVAQYLRESVERVTDAVKRGIAAGMIERDKSGQLHKSASGHSLVVGGMAADKEIRQRKLRERMGVA